MEKAYDVKELLEELKKKGIPLAEDAAENVVEAVFDWVEKSALASENKYDDFALALTPVLKKFVLEELVDKIDKSDNE